MKVPQLLLRPLARWAIARARRTPYFHLYNADGSLYMERFWLLRFGNAGISSNGHQMPVIGVRIHVIHSSDDGRDLHDHPWSFVTCLLENGYFEVRQWALNEPWDETETFHSEGSILFRRATDWHRLRLLPDLSGEMPVTTLFIQFPKVQDWGFLRNGVKVPWREYLAEKYPPPAPPPERCESGLPDCGPVEHYDSEGVPLCTRCWNELPSESTLVSSLSDESALPSANLAFEGSEEASISRDELVSALRILAWRIEACGASPALTHAVSLCSAIGAALTTAPDYALAEVRNAIEVGK